MPDGQAYLYWGNPHLYYAKLNKDMISFKGGIDAKAAPCMANSHALISNGFLRAKIFVGSSSKSIRI